ncbi:DUF3833 domain-containing protein [Sulfitobacter sp. D35]|uniref:DUF3833 domain-containing protein n=1 Tax=Sulfitobacter sp. D35 TaxID=3083252 RepID=UPI00296EA7C9|nr:DUF3833 domain-containing protein [Sulfitobacter sp. D35]MDW4498253.1 DUF3833 domain-containing protein [Sulfitobacter sp. D35]
MRAVAMLLCCLVVLAGCAGRPSLDDPSIGDQSLALEEYFDGDLTAYGQFQDVFGTVRRSFTVDITGRWDGLRLILDENFVYEDGARERRVWTLVKTGPDTWQGTAPGVIGVATGRVQDNRFNWRYTIDLPVPTADGPGETTRVSFDDWMWLLEDGRLLNRAYMTRYGVYVGDVTIFFEKR